MGATHYNSSCARKDIPLNPDIFNMDFERTEHSDKLHGILGRALIVATRFDSMCEAAAAMIKIKGNLIERVVCGEAEYKKFVSRIITKHVTLDKNIKSLGLTDDISNILHSAKKARNRVAHELARGLTGCLDIKPNEKNLIDEVSELIGTITCGDIVISTLISTLNNYQLPEIQFIKTHKEKMINWVIET